MSNEGLYEAKGAYRSHRTVTSENHSNLAKLSAESPKRMYPPSHLHWLGASPKPEQEQETEHGEQALRLNLLWEKGIQRDVHLSKVINLEA